MAILSATVLALASCGPGPEREPAKQVEQLTVDFITAGRNGTQYRRLTFSGSEEARLEQVWRDKEEASSVWPWYDGSFLVHSDRGPGWRVLSRDGKDVTEEHRERLAAIANTYIGSERDQTYHAFAIDRRGFWVLRAPLFAEEVTLTGPDEKVFKWKYKEVFQEPTTPYRMYASRNAFVVDYSDGSIRLNLNDGVNRTDSRLVERLDSRELCDWTKEQIVCPSESYQIPKDIYMFSMTALANWVVGIAKDRSSELVLIKDGQVRHRVILFDGDTAAFNPSVLWHSGKMEKVPR
jgi:hypothetical protein